MKNAKYQIPDSVELPKYYQGLDLKNNFLNPNILNLPNAGAMLEIYVWYQNRDNEQSVDGLFPYAMELLKEKELFNNIGE